MQVLSFSRTELDTLDSIERKSSDHPESLRVEKFSVEKSCMRVRFLRPSCRASIRKLKKFQDSRALIRKLLNDSIV